MPPLSTPWLPQSPPAERTSPPSLPASPDRTTLTDPTVMEVAPTSSVGVSQAEYDRQARILAITLRSVGDPAALRAASPVDATVTVGNVPGRAHIEVGGRPLTPGEYARQGDRLKFAAPSILRMKCAA